MMRKNWRRFELASLKLDPNLIPVTLFYTRFLLIQGTLEGDEREHKEIDVYCII